VSGADKAKNKVQNLVGKAKEAVGKVTGDTSTENEGKGDQAKSNQRMPARRSRTPSKSPSKSKVQRYFQPGEQFESHVAHFDVAPLGFVHQSGERLAWFAVVQRRASGRLPHCGPRTRHIDVCGGRKCSTIR
jgi:hypothetical protein